MSQKKVAFANVGPRPASAEADAWVQAGQDRTPTPTQDPVTPQVTATGEKSKTKRLTLDIPADLHRRIKADCAAREVSMLGEIQKLMEERWK